MRTGYFKTFLMSKILHQQDFRRTKLTPKKCENLVKIEIAKRQSTTKHHMCRATNLLQSRELYTKAVGDIGSYCA